MFYFVGLGIVGTVDVIIRTPDGTTVGETKYTYYWHDVEEAFMHLVDDFLPPEGESVGKQGVNQGSKENRGQNSATSSSCSGSYYYALFFMRMLFFRSRLNIVIFFDVRLKTFLNYS